MNQKNITYPLNDKPNIQLTAWLTDWYDEETDAPYILICKSNKYHLQPEWWPKGLLTYWNDKQNECDLHAEMMNQKSITYTLKKWTNENITYTLDRINQIMITYPLKMMNQIKTLTHWNDDKKYPLHSEIMNKTSVPTSLNNEKEANLHPKRWAKRLLLTS